MCRFRHFSSIPPQRSVIHTNMEKCFLIWLIILTILYCVLIEFQISDQKQINELEERKQDRPAVVPPDKDAKNS